MQATARQWTEHRMHHCSLEDGLQRPFTAAKPYINVVKNGFQKTIYLRTPTIYSLYQPARQRGISLTIAINPYNLIIVLTVCTVLYLKHTCITHTM